MTNSTFHTPDDSLALVKKHYEATGFGILVFDSTIWNEELHTFLTDGNDDNARVFKYGDNELCVYNLVKRTSEHAQEAFCYAALNKELAAYALLEEDGAIRVVGNQNYMYCTEDKGRVNFYIGGICVGGSVDNEAQGVH